MEARIFIGIPSNREDYKFLASINSFLGQLRGKCECVVAVVKWKEYPTALNRLIDLFLVSGCTHLLFLDDDHVGHSLEMFERLLFADKDAIGMYSFCRKYPHFSLLITDADGVLSPEERNGGIDKIAVTGTSMLLLKRNLLDKIDKPYFREHDVEAGKNCETDFCLRLRDNGFQLWGCWDFCLEHDGITKDNVEAARDRNAPTWANRLLASKKE